MNGGRRNASYIGRKWYTGLRASTEADIWIYSHGQARLLLPASSSGWTPVPWFPRTFLASISLALMGCGWSPRGPCLHHRIAWFQVKKSMAPNPSPWGLTIPFTTFCMISDFRMVVLLQPESFLRIGGRQSYQPCDSLGPVSVLDTEDLSKYLLY